MVRLSFYAEKMPFILMLRDKGSDFSLWRFSLVSYKDFFVYYFLEKHILTSVTFCFYSL